MKNRAKKIRPNQILQMGNDFGHSFTNFVPLKYSGSMSAFEYIVMIKLLNLIEPSKVFEFGTYMGNTTRFILENIVDFSDEPKLIYTLDLDSTDGVEFEGDDAALASKVVGTKRLYQESIHKNRVVQLLGDSLTFDFSSINSKFPFILIDANHALKYVKKDTENAYELLDYSSSYVIIWDDYEHPDFSDLTNYVDELAASGKNIYHVEETNWAIQLSDDLVVPACIVGVSL
jgi:predicted O-methyltransferase YrrM